MDWIASRIAPEGLLFRWEQEDATACAALGATLLREHALLARRLRDYQEHEWTAATRWCPGWCAAELVAHLVLSVGDYVDVLDGHPERSGPARNWDQVQRLQAAAIAPLAAGPRAILLERFVASGERLVARLAAESPARLAEPIALPFGGRAPRYALGVHRLFELAHHGVDLRAFHAADAPPIDPDNLRFSLPWTHALVRAGNRDRLVLGFSGDVDRVVVEIVAGPLGRGTVRCAGEAFVRLVARHRSLVETLNDGLATVSGSPQALTAFADGLSRWEHGL